MDSLAQAAGLERHVTAEDDLTLKMVRAVNEGISEATTQLRRSLGVTS